MAYGVKYRLEFSDLKENKKKIEILKNNYSGSVLPMVGGANPCTITWEQDDDVYTPIIGSTATLNIMVTDAISYDNFYEYDEREYQIKVSYWDGAAYQTYWKGWLTTDSYVEAITSAPYSITLKALDGLGTLSKYQTPLYDNGAAEPANVAKPPIYYFADILNNLGLDFDIYTSTELLTTSSSSYDIYEYLWNNLFQGQQTSYGFIPSNKILDAKKGLELILKFTHSRIFQSFGKWYIINASGYSEQSIKDELLAGTFAGSSIRDAETASLQTNGTESIKYKIYNSSGVLQSTSTVDVLQTIPGDLQPINNDLSKEYTRPLNDTSLEYDMSQNLNLVKHNYRFFWDNGSATNVGWQTANSCEFTTEQKIYNNSIKFYGSTSSLKSYTDGQVFINRIYKIDFKTYTSNTPQQLNVQIRVGDTYLGYQYYIVSSGAWQSTPVYNIVSLTKTDEWQTLSIDVEYPPHSTQPYIEVIAPNSTPTYPVYLGELLWTIKDYDSTGFKTQTRTLTRDAGNYSANISFDNFTISNQINYEYVLGSTTIAFQRPYEKQYGGNKDMANMKLQYVLNDHRNNLVKYSGTLYSNNITPLSVHNKIWVDFGTSILQEPVSCYIDGLTYNVKQNEYQVNMHVPNQDNDIAATLTIENT